MSLYPAHLPRIPAELAATMAIIRPNPHANEEKIKAEWQEKFGPEHVAEIRQLSAEAAADWERLYQLYAEYPTLSPDYPVELLIKPRPARPPRANRGALGIVSRIRTWLGVLSRGANLKGKLRWPKQR